MDEYKICPFCGKATDAAKCNCDFCNGFIQFHNLKSTDRAGAVKLNRGNTDGISPVGEFLPYDFTIIQVVSLAAAAMFLYSAFAVTTGILPDHLFLFLMLVLQAATWLLFGRFLRKFTGTDRISNPLIHMVWLEIAGVLLIPFGLFSGQGLSVWTLLFLLGAVSIVTGFVALIIAAVRMTGAKNGYIPLNMLGFAIIVSSVLYIIVRSVVVFMYPGMITAYRLEIFAAVLSVLPNLCLILVLIYARKKILTSSKNNNT